MSLYVTVVCFFVIALIYSSVGFGGGSSYLALLAVAGVARDVFQPAALMCNIIVVTGGTLIFYRTGALDMRRAWPILVASAPLAFIGGLWKIDDDSFFMLLGLSLIVASLFLWIQPEKLGKTSRVGAGFSPILGAGLGFVAGLVSIVAGVMLSDGIVEMTVFCFMVGASLIIASIYFWINEGKAGEVSVGGEAFNLGLGSAIGLLSGVVSIGGGIFLSPALHLMRWAEARKISALASVFILVNSIAGLAGQLTRSGTFDWKFILPLLVAVFLGGQAGSRLGAKKFKALYIKRITAVLILLAGLNILRDHLN